MIDRISIDAHHPYPQRVTEFTKPFWDGLAEGVFRTTAGAVTGRVSFPPKPISPHDWEEDITWVELSGLGTVYSHTTVHAAPAAFVDDLPYRICIVDLDEGVRLATRFLGEGELEVGGRIELVAVAYTDAMSFAVRSAHHS